MRSGWSAAPSGWPIGSEQMGAGLFTGSAPHLALVNEGRFMNNTQAVGSGVGQTGSNGLPQTRERRLVGQKETIDMNSAVIERTAGRIEAREFSSAGVLAQTIVLIGRVFYSAIFFMAASNFSRQAVASIGGQR